MLERGERKGEETLNTPRATAWGSHLSSPMVSRLLLPGAAISTVRPNRISGSSC